MRRADLLAFLGRDFSRVARWKGAHWKERQDRFGPAEALRAVEGLREQARMAAPGWPTSEQREEDLETHRRVAEALRRTPARGHPRKKQR